MLNVHFFTNMSSLFLLPLISNKLFTLYDPFNNSQFFSYHDNLSTVIFFPCILPTINCIVIHWFQANREKWCWLQWDSVMSHFFSYHGSQTYVICHPFFSLAVLLPLHCCSMITDKSIVAVFMINIVFKDWHIFCFPSLYCKELLITVFQLSGFLAFFPYEESYTTQLFVHPYCVFLVHWWDSYDSLE